MRGKQPHRASCRHRGMQPSALARMRWRPMVATLTPINARKHLARGGESRKGNTPCGQKPCGPSIAPKALSPSGISCSSYPCGVRCGLKAEVTFLCLDLRGQIRPIIYMATLRSGSRRGLGLRTSCWMWQYTAAKSFGYSLSFYVFSLETWVEVVRYKSDNSYVSCACMVGIFVDGQYP